jgi:hypothetical protein
MNFAVQAEYRTMRLNVRMKYGKSRAMFIGFNYPPELITIDQNVLGRL